LRRVKQEINTPRFEILSNLSFSRTVPSGALHGNGRSDNIERDDDNDTGDDWDTVWGVETEGVMTIR